MSEYTIGWGILLASSGMTLIYIVLSLMTRRSPLVTSVKPMKSMTIHSDLTAAETQPLLGLADHERECEGSQSPREQQAAKSLASVRILPPHRRRWRLIAAAVMTGILVFAIYKLVGPGTPTNAASQAATPLAQQLSGFLFVQQDEQAIFLDVQGSATTTTGTWDEVDVAQSKFVIHRWSFSYYFSPPDVRLVLATNTGSLTLYGIVNAAVTQITLRLPPDPHTGIFPPPAIFYQASEADYNDAVTTLAAEIPHPTATEPPHKGHQQ